MIILWFFCFFFFFFQAEDGIRDLYVTGVQTCALPIWSARTRRLKVPHFNRRVLADLLGHPEHLIHFIELEVGGGFGVRGEFYPEDFEIGRASCRERVESAVVGGVVERERGVEGRHA